MNKQRRKALHEAIDAIYKAMYLLENVRDEEQEVLDNIPENLQYSERYESMSEGVDTLNECCDNLLDMTTELEELL